MASFDLDLSTREIYSELSGREKEEMLNLLQNDGHSLYKREYHNLDNPVNLLFKKNLYKLGQIGFNISNEDQDILESLFKKYLF